MPKKWANKYERKPGRWVFDPTDEYREIGKQIKDATRKMWRAPIYYFHLRKGGHVSALRRHMRNKFFVRFDIEDFFGRINRTRITRELKAHFGYKEARRIADDSTVQHPDEKKRWVLPYGFVQSPILASLVLSRSRLGKELERLHRIKDFRVSVYVDDLIVSSNDQAKLEKAGEVLVGLASKSGLAFNAAKSRGPSATIDAFNVELTNASLAIVADRLKEFAADLGTGTEQQRRGILGYVQSVNVVQAAELKKLV